MTLKEHRLGLNTVKQQRRLLDQSLARLIAAGVKDGFSADDLLSEDDPTDTQPEFDL